MAVHFFVLNIKKRKEVMEMTKKQQQQEKKLDSEERKLDSEEKKLPIIDWTKIQGGCYGGF